MTKERIILALVAIIAGLILASSIFYFYQKKGSSVAIPESVSPTSSVPNEKAILEIESPEHESVTDRKTIEVKGKTQAGALIVLATNTEEFVFEASEDGSFNKTIKLSQDENIITVSAYPENGASETKELVVTYTTEEF